MIKEAVYAQDGLNVKLFYAINGLQGDVFEQFMLMGSALANFKLFPLYLGVLILSAWSYGKYCIQKEGATASGYNNKIVETVIFLIVSYGIYIVWVHGLKSFCSIPRPFVALPEGTVNILPRVKLSENPYVSLPSGHAAFSMMMLAGLWPILNRVGKIVGILLLLWVGFSRVALGVHFPSDVIFSWVISFVVVYLTAKFAMRLISILKLLFLYILSRYFKIVV